MGPISFYTFSKMNGSNFYHTFVIILIKLMFHFIINEINIIHIECLYYLD